MTAGGWICLLLCLIAAVAGGFATLRERRRTRQMMARLEEMLSAAMAGNFQEKDFDETLLSSFEASLSAYLSASSVSARNLRSEQTKIKTLIGDISHQTKTPIANLLLYTQLLQEQPLPAAGAEYVELLAMQVEKLRFLIDALVKISRLESGVLALAPRAAPVSGLIAAAVAGLSPKAAAKNIDLQISPTSAAACFDPKWTAEALANILDNAIKYTPARGKVTISARTYELFCRIDVTDTGPGIPEEEVPKIFGRFYRGAAVAEEEGVGIGLYLARQILATEGGYIKVSSVPGSGSTFSLFLPSEPCSVQILQNC